jgi:hypothetical protein
MIAGMPERVRDKYTSIFYQQFSFTASLLCSSPVLYGLFQDSWKQRR